MEKVKLNKQNKQCKAKKEGYIIVPNYFLRKWVKVLGIGPALLYLQLLSYCHKEKDIAWPTLTTLSSKLGISKNSLLSYRKILLKYGLIKKIVKRRTAQGNYQSNFYKITPIEGSANIELRQVQILGEGSAKIAPGVVQNLHPNNTNLKHYQGNNNKEGENAVVAVNFKKLKEKGEERMRAVKEQLMDLDFKEEFIEKIFKDYSTKKIEEKLDQLLNKKNIQNPPGWLRAALKNDYPTPHSHLNPPPSKGEETIRIDSRFHGNDIIPNVIANDRRECGNPNCRDSIHQTHSPYFPLPSEGEGQGEGEKILSTEEARERFKHLREKLKAMKTPYSSP